MLILLVLLSIIINQYTAHTEIRNNRWVLFRKFPKNKIACVFETEIASSVKTLANVSTFANFSTSLVFLLFRCPYFGETELDVGWKLEGGSVE